MMVFKIMLAEVPFWFLGENITLDTDNKVSDFINVESLSDNDIKIINKAANMFEIKLFDAENNRVRSINEIGYHRGDLSVDVEDIVDDESFLVPEIFSVTVTDQNDSEEEKKEEEITPTAADFENARIILKKNGNTVKKTIKNIPNDPDGLYLLHACLQVEKETTKRTNVVKAIENKIAEFLNV